MCPTCNRQIQTVEEVIRSRSNQAREASIGISVVRLKELLNLRSLLNRFPHSPHRRLMESRLEALEEYVRSQLQLLSHQQMKEVYDGYVEEEVLAGVFQHAKAGLPSMVIGYLVGEYCSWRGRRYTFVRGYVHAPSQSSGSHVEFKDGTIIGVLTEIHEKHPRLLLVGWYHSRPHSDCRLSDIDERTHRTYFTEPYHLLAVVDPVTGRYKFYRRDALSDEFHHVAMRIRRTYVTDSGFHVVTS